MKLEKNSWIFPVISVLYFLSALWTVTARFINGLLCSHADATAVIIFSYVDNAANAALLGAGLAVAFGFAAGGCSGACKTAFKLGMSGAIVAFVYFLFYLLFSSSSTIIYVDLILILAFGLLEFSMFCIFAFKTCSDLRVWAFISAAAALISALTLSAQMLSTIMIMVSHNILEWMEILAFAGKAELFCDIIHCILCGMFFLLARENSK